MIVFCGGKIIEITAGCIKTYKINKESDRIDLVQSRELTSNITQMLMWEKGSNGR